MNAAPYTPTDDHPTPLTATLAASGLLDGLELHRAASRVASQLSTSAEDYDRRLAEGLVESGVLNRWQVGQLQRGRTKFNLGAYRILDSIARGGMGHVFKGEHELLGRVEAIKVLPRAKTSPEAIASFRHEIRAQASLDHPNLVRVTYADRDRETYFLVTEYVPGIDLRRLIRREGPLEESAAALVLSQACEAIDHAHRRGFVHRDVKPGNVLITPDGRVKVTDLGLAWSLDGLIDSSLAYEEGKIAGTSDYVAPEVVQDPSRIRPESDLYGLGCTLYYAVTGKVPYPGGGHLDKLRRRLREAPIDPRTLAPKLSHAMAELIERLMASRPEDRPASAGMVAAELASMTDAAASDLLAAAVTDATAHRPASDDTTPSWSGVDTHDLPETVGLPLHDLPPEALAAPEPDRPSPQKAGWGAPQWVAVVALGAVLAILAAAAWQALAG
ncbi:Serine/threonine-protein kinase StkP [Planctomycetes bacterium MalM25]|nr:Serine/threonine-protein kinase StkP [Planctomycetes bacterium MalM25]